MQVFGLPSSTGPLGFPNKVCDKLELTIIETCDKIFAGWFNQTRCPGHFQCVHEAIKDCAACPTLSAADQIRRRTCKLCVRNCLPHGGIVLTETLSLLTLQFLPIAKSFSFYLSKHFSRNVSNFMQLVVFGLPVNLLTKRTVKTLLLQSLHVIKKAKL